MTLHRAITKARRETATAANRLRQHRAELRLEEIVKVAGIADEYDAADRDGDLSIESHFANCYQLARDEDTRAAIVDAFVAWQSDEKAEECVVRESVGTSVSMLKRHNPAFIDGAWVPDGDGGAA